VNMCGTATLVPSELELNVAADTFSLSCSPLLPSVSPSGPVPTGQERVATVFTWTHGGKNVAVTGTCSHMSPSHFLRPTLSYAVVWLGTWNNWQDVIPLNRSEHDFTAIIDLPPGVHQYAPTMCQTCH
jgi:hypothetical protein